MSSIHTFSSQIENFYTVAGNDVRDTCKVKPRMFSNQAYVTICQVEIYRKYSSRRPLEYCHSTSPFYVATSTKYPDTDVIPSKNATWFRAQPIGVNKLAGLMKQMSETAGLRALTNHSARKHLLQKLNDAGVLPMHIMQVTGHKNVSSMNSYSSITINQQ